MIRNFFISGQRLKAYSLALLLALSSACSLLISPVVNAASDYGIKVTDSIHIGGTQYAGTCDLHEMSVSWSELMSPDTHNEWSYKNTWNYTSNYDNARATLDAFHDSFAANLATGSGWAVQQGPATDNGAADYLRIYTFDPTATLQIDDGRITPSPGEFKVVSFMLNPNAGCRFQAWEYNGGFSSISVNDSHPIFLIATDHLVYPSDYSGPQIPSSYIPKPDFYVPYILNVDDKKITLTPKPADARGNCWKWAATLVKKGTSTSDNLGDWEVISETDYLAPDAPANLKAREYGSDYAIGLLAYDCDAPEVKLSDTFNLKLERLQPLKIDGTSYVLDSDNLNCDNGGICEEPSPFKDCSIFGTDLIKGLDCVIQNFGIFLRSLLVTLFVPAPGPFNDAFNDLKTTFTNKLGFLIYPITFVGSLLTELQRYDNNGGCVPEICQPTFSAPGGVIPSFTIDFGAIQNHWPTLWGYIQTSLIGVTVFALIIALYHKYMRIIKG